MNDTTTASAPNTPRRRRKSRTGLIAAIVVILAAGGWYGVHKYLHRGDKEGEYLFAAVTSGDIEDLVTSTGTLQPRDYVDVGAQVSGQIDNLYVEVGDVVKKGQKLATIDATQAEAKVESQKAQLESQKNTMLSQIDSLEKATRDYERQKNLYAQDASTKQSLLDAETAFKNAQRTKTNSELSITQQEATMRIDAKNLEYTTIVAPIDGTVMSIAVKLGQTVNATQNVPTVLRIANLSTMTVAADVSEADVSKLYKGIPVYFTTLGANRRWYSTLKRIEPTPKSQQGVVLYNAVFDVENEGTSLNPGQTAQVYFVSSQANGVLMVPMAALQQGQQIVRELAAKDKEKKGSAKAGGTPGAPGLPGATGTATGIAAGAAVAANGGNPAGASTTAAAPTPAAAGSPRPGATTPAAAGASPQTAAAGGTPEQGRRPGGQQGGAAAGGQRPGGFAGFNPQSLTPEQQEQYRRMLEQRQAAGGGQGGGFGQGGFGQRGAGGAGGFGQRGAGGAGGFGQRGAGGAGGFGQRGAGGAGGFGQRGAGNFNAMGAPAAAGVPRAASRRNGIVMVKKADGTLEQRRVVVGVTNRVLGQVLEGLKEGEEVVVGKREKEPAPGTNNNQNQQNQGNQQLQNQLRQQFQQGGGFPGGGGGGNFRP